MTMGCGAPGPVEPAQAAIELGPLPSSRPAEQTCRFDGWEPDRPPPLAFEPTAAPAVPLVSALTVSPSTGVIIAGTRDGAVLAIDPEAPGVVHPLRPADGVSVTGLAVDETGTALFIRTRLELPARARVSRLTMVAPLSADPESEQEVVTIAYDGPGRIGEGLAIAGAMLWIPLGDGAEGEATGPADDPTERAGNLLRLDVSDPAAPFALPSDNPFADRPGAGPETWAHGLREPTACAFDPQRERLWCTDVGDGVSEANLIEAGDDLGWPRANGHHCRLPDGCEGLGLTAPAGAYRLAEDDCGVGPAVVADGMDPAIDGMLVFADRCSGRTLAAAPGPESPLLVARMEPPLVAMAADPEGGAWAVDEDGRLGRLVARRPAGTFPERLVESGCFAELASLAPGPDLVPYGLNAPLWTDGASKLRHLVLPPGTHIGVGSGGELGWPEGTLLLKTFAYSDVELPDVVHPVETRVMIRRDFGWTFHTYAWDDDGEDAVLVYEAPTLRLEAPIDGEPHDIEHAFPTREECALCHGFGEGRVLGPRLDQLDRPVRYDGVAASQLQSLEALDLFEGSLPSTTAVADPGDAGRTIEERARAHLHANCAHCHQPGGWTPPDLDLDLRYDTAFADTALCNVRPQYATPFPAQRRIRPGDPEDSLVWQRITVRDPWQMPPLGTSVVDPEAEVVREWIEQLSECP